MSCLVQPMNGHTSTAWDVAFSRHGTHMAMLPRNFNALSRFVQTLTGHASTVWDVAFSRDGSHMASVSDDRSLRVWECAMEGSQPR